MTDSKQEFMARVVQATTASPYSVTGTPEGFDLRTDIGDGQWLDRLRSEGVAQAHLHHVVVEGLTYKITSDSRDLSWGAGAPVLATPKDVRKASRGTKRVVVDGGLERGLPDGGDPFGPEDGRRVILTVGAELGLTHKQTGRRLEIALTAAAIIATVALSFAVAIWVLFFR